MDILIIIHGCLKNYLCNINAVFENNAYIFFKLFMDFLQIIYEIFVVFLKMMHVLFMDFLKKYF